MLGWVNLAKLILYYVELEQFSQFSQIMQNYVELGQFSQFS